MASPMTTGGHAAHGWPSAPPHQPMCTAPSEADEMGVQVRPMALKVHYTFDKDSKVNCLARWPQTLQIQTIPIDERSWIGIVDLRLCIQAIAQGSPELLAQNELDYAIYAVDFSEPDTPLVGQGMLSWVMDPTSAAAASSQTMDDGPKLVTGRVAKNMMAFFGNGVRETLEVRLKLSEVVCMGRSDSGSNGMNDSTNTSYGRAGNVMMSTDTTEWNSFLQSNPALGRSANISTMHQSPNMMQAHPDMSGYPPVILPMGMTTSSYDAGAQSMSRSASGPGSRPGSRQSGGPSSLAPTRPGSQLLMPRPAISYGMSGSPPPQPPLSSVVNDSHSYMSASTMPPAEVPQIREASARTSRPASRSRAPTGRPRGRPRKRQLTDGNTSAAEEMPTDGDADDAQKKKRVKTTKADYPVRTSLDSAPDSLRVAASTNGSLRTLRPIAPAPNSNGDGPAAPLSHLQEYPRAPTPVPQDAGGPPSQHARKMMAQKARRESLAGFESSSFPDSAYMRSVDAHSPTDSIMPSPENYTPEDSPADIGSSPPVPRNTSYVPQSSPIPSSPPLPPMRHQQPDSGFMSGGVDDVFSYDECMTEKEPPPPTPADTAAPTPNMDFAMPSAQSDAVAPPPPEHTLPTSPSESQPRKTKNQKKSQSGGTATKQAAARSTKSAANQAANRRKNARPVEQFSFLPINPGPPEFLPTTMLYNPPPQPKSQAGKNQRTGSMVRDSAPPLLERSHSEPSHPVQPDQQPRAQSQPQLQPQQQQEAETRQPSLPLPSNVGNTVEMPMPTTSESQSRPKTAPIPSDVVPDDMAELAKYLAESADSTSQENDATAASASTAAEDSSKSSQPAQPVLPQQPAAEVARATGSLSAPSFAPRATAVPASDPPALPPLALPTLPPPPTAFSEAPCPPSDNDIFNGRTKNEVRKAAIRERLQKAIESGETPPYCQNCGAIETPTWRKMWTQDHDGEPGFYDFSEKPGHVTAVDVLERDEDNKATRYRLVKKSLSNTDDGRLWTQMLLCNPCGIWLSKAKSHRPADRWDKDASRLTQPRRKLGSKSGGSRSRASHAKSETQQLQLTSEAYFTTDPAGPIELEETPPPSASTSHIPQSVAAAASQPRSSSDCPLTLPAAPTPPASTSESALSMPSQLPQQKSIATTATNAATEFPDKDMLQQSVFKAGSNQGPVSGGGSASRRGPKSTYSRGSGTADSPVFVDEHFGTTRRLLFPSPRKDGVLKVLGELAVNVIGSVLGSPKPNKDSSHQFDNLERPESKQGGYGNGNENESVNKEAGANKSANNDSTATMDDFDHDDMADLFGTPPPNTAARPSTPPPKSGNDGSPSFTSGPFKTPTRPTPSHRPITRSVSKSFRSGVSCPKSPAMDSGLMYFQCTPSKTPRSAAHSSAIRQRHLASVTPKRQQQQQHQNSNNAHLDSITFDTPFTSTLNQLLSEANDFTTGSPSHGLTDLDLASLANLEGDELAAEFHSSTTDLDFGSYVDSDLMLPNCSSPLMGRKTSGKHQNSHKQASFGGALTFEASESLWSDFNDATQADNENK